MYEGIKKMRYLAAAAILCSRLASAQSELPPLALKPEQDSKLHELLAKTLQNVQKAGCKKNASCKILVMNFTDAKGNTSNFGMRLAQRLSYDAVFHLSGAQTVSYDDLRAYLIKERIPSHLLVDPLAESWLAREFTADTTLVGQISQDGSKLSIELQLVGAKNGPKSSKEKTEISYVAEPSELAPAEPYGPMPDFVINGERIEKLATTDLGERYTMTAPHCTYKPDPPYTEAARQAKVQGHIVLQVALSKDGQILDVRPLVGAPFGLNRVSTDTVQTWKCNPATQNGAQITVLVPVEITFRLF